MWVTDWATDTTTGAVRWVNTTGTTGIICDSVTHIYVTPPPLPPDGYPVVRTNNYNPKQETIKERTMKQTDINLYDGEGAYLKTCADMTEATREAKRLAAKNKDEIRIVRCVKVVRPKPVDVETEDV
jgi:hypothetical protein